MNVWKALVSFYAKSIIFRTSEIFLEPMLLKVCLAVFSIIAHYGEHLLLMLCHIFLIDCVARLNDLLYLSVSALFSSHLLQIWPPKLLFAELAFIPVFQEICPSNSVNKTIVIRIIIRKHHKIWSIFLLFIVFGSSDEFRRNLIWVLDTIFSTALSSLG